MMSRLIGIYSPYPRSGKSTVAQEFTKLSGTKLAKFADPIREVVVPFAAEFLPGGEAEVLEWLNDDRKDTHVIPGLNVTLRHLLQTQGVWARNAIHPDLYVLIMRERLSSRYHNFRTVVIDDVRYENEHALIRKRRDAVLIRVDRIGGLGPVAEHESNGRLEHLSFDYHLSNDSTEDDLRCKARVIAWDLGITG